MAKAYLGKISALVTANTSDFNSKLNASAKEVRSFAASMQSTLSRAQTSATTSLRGIYTESQKVSRALQAVATQRLSFKGFDQSAVGSIREAVDQFRALQAASVAVNEPLASAARTVERLSASVQQSFDPALKSAQKSAEYLDAALKRGGIVGEQSFDRIRQKAVAATDAANRLAEASQLAAAGPRGNELAFAAPRVRDALAASADVRQRAANAPAAALEGSRVSSDVQKLVALDNLIQKRRAEIESGTILNIDTTQARASLENLLAVAKRVRDQVSSAIGGGPDAATATLINRARAQREFYEESERLAKQAAADDAALIAARTNAQREGYEERIRLERQAAADEVTLIARRTNAQRDASEERTRLEKQAAEDAAALLIRRAKAQQEFEEERRRLDAVAADDAAKEIAPTINRARAQRESAIDFGLDLDAPKRQIEVLRGSIVSLKGQLDALPVVVRSQFAPAILEAQRNLEVLAAAPAATAEQIENATAEVNRLSAAATRASKSFNFRDRFGGGAGGLNDVFQDQALRGYTAQLDVLQGALGRVSAEARGPGVAAFARLRDFIFRAARTGTLEFEATQNEIRDLTREAVAATAAVAGIGRGGLARSLQRAGDVGRAGFDRFGLGVQQAAFAIDDFFSVTGGIEQRLRAVGNNLTQLGFIVGGTAGLFTALAFTAGTQIVIALAKFIRGGAEAKEIAAGLNDRLERQRTLVGEISKGFNEIGDAVAEGAFSEATKRSEAFEKRLSAVIDKLKELREASAQSLDPELTLAAGRLGTLEKNLKEADSVPLAAARRASVRDARRQVEEIQGRITSREPFTRQQLQDAIGESFGGAGRFVLPQGVDNRGILQVLERRESELGQVVDSWLSTFIEPFSQAEARRRISVVSDAIDRLTAEIARGIEDVASNSFRQSTRRFQSSSSAASRLLEQSQRSGGDTEATRSLQSGIERDAARFRSAVKQFNDAVANGRQDEADKAARLLSVISDSASTREREAKAIRDSANAASRFGDVLQRFRELNDTILRDVTSTAEQARREAVQSVATSAAGLSRQGDSEFAQQRSNRLQRELRDAESRRRDIESSALEAERRFRQESPDQNIRRLAEESARARALAEDQTRSDRARADARQRQLEADQQLRRGFDASPQGRALQAQLDDADRQARVALERDSLIARGRDLSLSEGDRAGRELGDRLRAINESFDSQVRELQRADPFADVAGIEAGRREAIRRAQEDTFRSVAPLLAALQDSVRNAVLAGPSRAALNASDVTTTQGQQELNRLLRGDDPARDQDLVALQKQANEYLKVISEKREPQVAN